ncbi:MAG: type II toxin-antitoxin system RelE/ParE family toxin [Rickettsiaceae bacterium]|nr:type II toxin-antitoxin system RelE/ParE family toxin [Rickettsiaceae bacterium]
MSLEPKKLGKMLSAEFSGLFRYRFGNYRVIYEIFDEQLRIVVVRVGHRSKVYD